MWRNVKAYAHKMLSVWRLNMELRMVAVVSGPNQEIAGSRIVPTKKAATEHIGIQIFMLNVIHTFTAPLNNIYFQILFSIPKLTNAEILSNSV